MTERWKGITTNIIQKVYDNKYISIFDNVVTFPRGNIGTYLKIEWKAPHSVAILPILKNGNMLLVQNFRYASDRFSIEVPKGFGDYHCSPIEKAMHELAEEAGLISHDIRQLSILKTEPGLINHDIYLFLARDCEKLNVISLEDTEVMDEPMSLSIDDALGRIGDGSINDCITVSSILLYRQMLAL